MSKRKSLSIARKVRQERKKREISQDKLAKLAGVAYNTIVKIESGESSNPTVGTMKKIAKALQVQLDKLL
jgi:transcriptional regulator with XRE-family HTH domain